MSVELLTEHHLELLSLKETTQARLNLHLSKCSHVSAHMGLNARGKAQTSLLSDTETSLDIELCMEQV